MIDISRRDKLLYGTADRQTWRHAPPEFEHVAPGVVKAAQKLSQSHPRANVSFYVPAHHGDAYKEAMQQKLNRTQLEYFNAMSPHEPAAQVSDQMDDAEEKNIEASVDTCLKIINITFIRMCPVPNTLDG